MAIAKRRQGEISLVSAFLHFREIFTVPKKDENMENLLGVVYNTFNIEQIPLRRWK